MRNGLKKILFIITQSEFGGAQRFLMELVTHLDPDRFEISVASSADPGDLLHALKAKQIATHPLKWLTRDISPFGDLMALFEIRGLLKREQPDALFLLSSKAGFLGSLAAKSLVTRYALLDTRIIYRIGGWAFNDPNSWLKRKIYLWAEKLSARWKDIIIVNAERDRLQAELLGIKPRKKLLTIYNGINTSSLNFLSKNEARQRLMQTTPSLRHSVTPSLLVGCIANFYKTKGLPVLIDAMARVHKTHPDAKLIVIGDGRERQDLETRIMKREAQNYILLAGRMAEAWRYLQAFDVFVLPSLKEGFPWVLLEAMAAEIPIVATSVGAVPEIIENKKSGIIVPPDDPASLVQGIAALLDNPERATAMAQEAKRVLEQKFGLKKMLGEIISLL
ncbi:MAG: glycosyltransferase family 4 protein [bacterium]|nr:glycosyltransferase family 4 protein [bacterium]